MGLLVQHVKHQCEPIQVLVFLHMSLDTEDNTLVFMPTISMIYLWEAALSHVFF